MTIDYKKYKGFQDIDLDISILTDKQGRLRTASLFAETVALGVEEKYPPLYTLRNRDYKELPSAYLIYMSSVDEFEAAIKLVGSMAHWRRLLETPWFLNGDDKTKTWEGLETWRLDMALRDMSTSKRELVDSAGKHDTSSARKLFDIANEAMNKKKGPGRPATAKDKKDAEKAEQQAEDDKALEDLHRRQFGDK